ncbi:hypothetical protein NDU88_003375 [Pleurodeles waltl]|uniref:Uncharacterized protein n=1 Tax=Pleurodeles waltl TaxID=8319 RepID=A0AAV7W549_PLEWA|nr:hypothetical protein NDU88_003375 [Pleurodeles waltl]
MDQAIASLKAQTSSSGEGASSIEDGPWRVGIPSSEAFPPTSKRMQGQRKGKGAGGRRTESTHAQVGEDVNLASTWLEVSASPIVGAGQAGSGGQSQAAAQTAGAVVPPQNTVAGKYTGASSEGESSQRDLAGHLVSVLRWVSEVDLLSTNLVGGPLPGANEGDVREQARRLVSRLGTTKSEQGSQGKGSESNTCMGVGGQLLVLNPYRGDQLTTAAPSAAQPVTSVSGAPATQTVNPPAVMTSTATTLVAQGTASAGTGHPSPLTDLGDIFLEHEQLGRHVPIEVKEKIWKGAYIDIFNLLVDKAEKEEVRRCKECAYS